MGARKTKMKNLLLTTALLTAMSGVQANEYSKWEDSTVILNTPTSQYSVKMSGYATTTSIRSEDGEWFMRDEGDHVVFSHLGWECPESVGEGNYCLATWEFPDGSYKGEFYSSSLLGGKTHVSSASYVLVNEQTPVYDNGVLYMPMLNMNGKPITNVQLKFEDGNFKLISYQE